MSLYEILNIESPIEVVDIGASINDAETASYQSLLDNGWANLVGFEPDAEEIKKLNERKKNNEKYLPYFIGMGKEETFYETNWALTGSLYEPNTELLSKFNNLNECMSLKDSHLVETIKLDDVDEIKDIDFVKMDIQGGELNALKYGKNKIKDVQVIQLEVEFLELYRNQPMFADVDILLRKLGFQFHSFLGFGSRSFKPFVVKEHPLLMQQDVWADAIYVRDWMKLSKINIEKLKKYAVIMHYVYKSPDLCSFILSELDSRINETYSQRYIDLFKIMKSNNNLVSSNLIDQMNKQKQEDLFLV